MSAPYLLRCRDLCVHVGSLTVCRDLNWQLAAGECWAVLGGNGVGKTTLLHTLAGLRHATTGVVELNDQPLSSLHRKQVAQHIGLLPQDFQDVFPGTVLETALIGRHPHLSMWRWENEEDMRQARQALVEVDLHALLARDVSTLSGGERRRLGLATLLTQAPSTLLLDEPTNHLDVKHQHTMLALINARVRNTACGAVMSLHDINLASRYCDHAMLMMGDGETIYGSIDSVMTPENLSRLYDWPLRQIETPAGRYFIPD